MPGDRLHRLTNRLSNLLRRGRELLANQTGMLPLIIAIAICCFTVLAGVGWLYKIPSHIYFFIVAALVVTNILVYFWSEHLLAQKDRTSVPVLEHMQSKERINALNSITRILAKSDNVTAGITEVISLICTVFRWDVGSFWTLDKDHGVLLCLTQWHNPLINTDSFTGASKSMRFTIGQGLPGRVWRTREAAWIENVSIDGNFQRQSAALHDNLRSAFALPVFYGDRFLGALEFFSKETRSRDESLWEMFTAIGSQLGQFIHHTEVQGALSENEMLFRQLAENLKVVFWISSPGGTEFYYISPAFEELTGHSCKEAYARPELLMEILLPEDRKLAARHVKQDLHSTTGGEGEYRVVHPDGTTRWILARTFPVTDEQGKLFRICGIGQDITTRKEAEKRVSEFYSTVSHELRTPLTSIRGSLGLMEGGLAGEIPDKARRFIEIARSESDRLIRLINDILDLRKIEAGKLDLRMEELSAAELVQASIDSVRGMSFEACVQLVTNLPAGDSRISCDRDRIIQVLTNLLSNAIKYSPSNTAVVLDVKLAERPQFLLFSIKDSGSGIAISQLPKLFGKFQQLDSSDSRAKGGTGLGLSISKAIVEQHGGRIGVETATGQGSTFWFELPVKEALAKPTSIKQSGPYSNTALLGKTNVLLIEDDPSTRSVLVDLLNSIGVKSLEARDGKTAVQLAASLPVHLIIMDLWVPKPNGFELVELFRQGPHGSTPLLVYTGHDLTEEDRQNLTLGATKYLIKTKTSQPQFLEAVKELLHESAPALQDARTA